VADSRCQIPGVVDVVKRERGWNGRGLFALRPVQSSDLDRSGGPGGYDKLKPNRAEKGWLKIGEPHEPDKDGTKLGGGGTLKKEKIGTREKTPERETDKISICDEWENLLSTDRSERKTNKKRAGTEREENLGSKNQLPHINDSVCPVRGAEGGNGSVTPEPFRSKKQAWVFA